MRVHTHNAISHTHNAISLTHTSNTHRAPLSETIYTLKATTIFSQHDKCS